MPSSFRGPCALVCVFAGSAVLVVAMAALESGSGFIGLALLLPGTALLAAAVCLLASVETDAAPPNDMGQRMAFRFGAGQIGLGLLSSGLGVMVYREPVVRAGGVLAGVAFLFAGTVCLGGWYRGRMASRT